MRNISTTESNKYDFFASPSFDLKKRIIFLVVSYLRSIKDGETFKVTPESEFIPDKTIPIADDTLVFADLRMFQPNEEFHILTPVDLGGLTCFDVEQKNEDETTTSVGRVYPAFSFLLGTSIGQLIPEIFALRSEVESGNTESALAILDVIASMLVYDKIKNQVESFICDNFLY